MHSTLTAREADPHDIFVIEPDVVLAARADQAPVHDALSRLAASRSHVAPDTVSPPPVEPTFRGSAIDDLKLDEIKVDAIKVDKILGERPPTARWVRRAVMAVLALCSAVAAAAWQQYGDDARQMIASFAPPFAFASSPPAEKSPLTEPSNAPAIIAAADQATAPPAASAQPMDSAAPVVTASSTDSTPLVQSMARDLATMGQQIEQLKAEIQELRAGQSPISRDTSQTSEIKPTDVKPPEVRPSELRPAGQNPRPRISALSPPPRPAAAPVRKPRPAFSPAPAAAPAVPPAAAAPVPSQPAPQVPASTQDDEPVIRPPMPVR